MNKEQALKILEDVSTYEIIKLAWDVLPEHGSGTAYTILDLEDGSVKSYYIPAGEIAEAAPHEIVLYELKNSRAHVIEEVFFGQDIDEDDINEEDVLDELTENCSTNFNQLVEQHYQAE
jgi:hypothetical protein